MNGETVIIYYNSQHQLRSSERFHCRIVGIGGPVCRSFIITWSPLGEYSTQYFSQVLSFIVQHLFPLQWEVCVYLILDKVNLLNVWLSTHQQAVIVNMNTSYYSSRFLLQNQQLNFSHQTTSPPLLLKTFTSYLCSNFWSKWELNS